MAALDVTLTLERAARSRWAPLPVLMAGTFMTVLDFFIVNVALPAMQSGLHASASGLEWVVAGYGITFATTLVSGGRLGDLLGRRRMFCTGVGLFTLTSLACGLAPTATALVVFRLLQGLSAALISPSVLSIIGVTFRGADRARALTVYGMVMGVAAASAQLIGGMLVQADILGTGWRGVFLINVPVGLMALALAPSIVPESRSESARGIDLAGTALLTAGLVAVVLPLVEGRAHGWPAWTWASLALAPALLVSFVLHQRALAARGGAPLLDLSMFRDRAFTAGNLGQVALWSGQASFFLVLALYLQKGRGLGAMQAGLVFTVLAAAYLVASLRAPMLAVRHGRRVIAGGAMVLAAGHASLAVGAGLTGSRGGIAWLLPGLVLVGAGMGLCITPLVSTVLANVDPLRAGVASGTLATMQQVGNSLGVAVTGVIFFGIVAGGGGYARAFQLSVAELAVLLLGLALLTRLLPAQRRAA